MACLPAIRMPRTALFAIALMAGGQLAAAPKTDVVVFINGERLTGEVKGLERGILSYSTDFMGTIEIEWDKVAQLRSDQLLEIELLDGTRAVARPAEFGETGTLLIGNDGAGRSVPLANASRIYALDEGRLRDRLDGYVSFAWSAAAANDVSQVSMNAGLTYRDEKRLWDLTYDGARSESDENPSAESHTVAFDQQIFLRNRWFWNGGGNFASNDELGLDLRVPVGAVNNEIVHQMDLFPTIARIAGGKVPTDRVIDGIDMTDFLSGKQAKSGREGIVVYVGNDIHGVKWRNWKMMTKHMDSGDSPVLELSLPHFFNLLTDPREQYPAAPGVPESLWVRYPAGAILTRHLVSLQKEPPIKPGTPDPYSPAK